MRIFPSNGWLATRIVLNFNGLGAEGHFCVPASLSYVIEYEASPWLYTVGGGNGATLQDYHTRLNSSSII